MGRRAVTVEQRQRLLEAFRSDDAPGTPASFRRVGQAAGVDGRTARRAWERGWPSLKPIRNLLEVEKTLARAALRKEALAQKLDEASRLAQEDAVETRVQEGRQVRAVATATTSLLVALHAEKVFEYARTLCKLMRDEQDPGSVIATGARRAFTDLTAIVSRLADAAQRGQAMQRILLGEPTAIVAGEIGIRPVTPVLARPEELAVEIEAANRALAEMKALEASTQLKKEAGADAPGQPPLAN